MCVRTQKKSRYIFQNFFWGGGCHQTQSGKFPDFFNEPFPYSHFILQQFFFQVRFSKYSTHSICDICLALNKFKNSCRTEQDLHLAIEAKRLHQLNFSGARRKMEEIKQLSIRYPKDHLVIQLDGMDNTKSYCPRWLLRGKRDVNKPTLPTKIQGCIMYSNLYEYKRKVSFFLNHNHFEQGGSLVVTLIQRLLLSFFEDHKFIPKHLHIFADNCWRENKVIGNLGINLLFSPFENIAM